MRTLVKIIAICCLGMFIWACSSSKVENKLPKEEPVVIANDSLEYEIIIIDIGFNQFLNTIAQPMNFHSQKYLEARNRDYVLAWNSRVMNPAVFDSNIYANIIDYEPTVDYGLEVNYKLFNYFLFAQRKYNIRLRNVPITRLR